MQPWAWAQAMHAHGLLDSQERIGAFQSLCGCLISHLFPLSSLVSLLCAPTFVHGCRRLVCSKIDYNCFLQMSLGQRFWYWANSESGQIRIVLKMAPSKEQPDRSDNHISQGMRL